MILTTGHRPVPWETRDGVFDHLPREADTDAGYGLACGNGWQGWRCTRVPDHDGTCRAALLGGRIVAEWWDAS